MPSGQLNVFSYRNQNTSDIQQVRLFECDELRACLVVMPPGAAIETHAHAQCNELFDVVEGEGQFTVDGRSFRGDFGKCVFVPAGTPHSIGVVGEFLHRLAWTVQPSHRVRLELGSMASAGFRRHADAPTGILTQVAPG